MLFLAVSATMVLWSRRSPKLEATTSGAADATGTLPALARRDVFGLCFSRVFLCGLILSLVLLGYLMLRVMIPAWTILPIEPRFRATEARFVRILDWANFVMLTVLMAFVADAVLLCTLFVADLRRQRNVYDQKGAGWDVEESETLRGAERPSR